jgi:hypothetical protein
MWPVPSHPYLVIIVGLMIEPSLLLIELPLPPSVLVAPWTITASAI